LTGSFELSYKGPGGVILRGLLIARQILWILSLATQVGLGARLLLINRTRYCWFLAYLAASSLGTLYLLTLPVRSTRYTISWIAIQTLTVILVYAAALEIYANLIRPLGGLTRQGKIVYYLRRVLNAVMLLSLIVCIGLAYFDARSMANGTPFSLRAALSTAVLLKRIATSTLALFLSGSALYFARFRFSLEHNLRVHGFLFTAWMIVSACALFWRNLDIYSATVINVVFLSASVLIFGVWMVALKKTGEGMPLRLSMPEGRAQADREIVISFLRRLTRQR
jgi:hypothetical protein